jgi:hypothetical protein
MAASSHPSAALLRSVLHTARAAARKAGELIMANKGAVAVAHTKDGDKDLVTVVDKQCEDVGVQNPLSVLLQCCLQRYGTVPSLNKEPMLWKFALYR